MTHNAIKQLINKNIFLLSFTILFSGNILAQCTDLPVPDFQHTAPACFGDTVYFTDYSSTPNGTIDIWEWKFGDGNSTIINAPSNPNTSHYYGLEGVFTVTLIVTDSDGCIDSIAKDISVVPNPVANFQNTVACEGEAVEFTDLSSQNNGSAFVLWYWNFGDPVSGTNNTSNVQNPNHIFTTAGTTYDVTLVVINLDGCSDTTIKVVNVYSEPTVDFTVDADTSCLGNIVHFYGSGANVASWFWEFGDGGTDIIQNPDYVYYSYGTFNVTLTIIDFNGCTNFVTYPVYINQLPTALFNVSSPSCSGDSIYLTDYSSSPGGYITSWHWYFGDGNETTILFPDNPDIAHLYANSGTYSISLVVEDSQGCTDSIPNDVVIIPSPMANFSWTTACYQQEVEFTDESLPNGGGNIISWFWNFGDELSGVNNTSAQQNPTHIFTDIGDYIVSLTAYNVNGCIDSTSYTVYVNPPPVIDFTMDTDSTCVGTINNFYGTGTDIIIWHWEFGDGDTSNIQNPMHIYNLPGTYDVELSVTNNLGCINNVMHTVWVNDQPVSNFSFINWCLNDSTFFTDESYSNTSIVTSWTWDFDDPASGNNTSTLQNPAHLFTGIGSFDVKLLITDLNGCTDSIVKNVQIFDLPNPLYSYQKVCDPHGTISFYDESTPGGNGSPIGEWYWEIDNTYYSTSQNPTYTYTITDTCYHVTLTVTDFNQCSSSFVDTICILDPLVTDFTATQVCHTHATFFQSSYTPSEDSIISYKWEFGDGSNPISSAFDTISHTYANSGTYQVVLTLTNLDNCTVSTYHNVIVNPLPIPNFSFDNAICNNPTQFTDLSSGNGSEMLTWNWDFGDVFSGANNFSLLQHPSHVYPPIDSTYYVQLITTNLLGCSDSITIQITKEPCVSAAFEVLTEPSCANQIVCFSENSSVAQGAGTIVNWEWDWGDGNTDSYLIYQASICHNYSGSGYFDVSITVTANVNGNLFADTKTQNIYIIPSPEAQFSTVSACTNTTVFFTDESENYGIPIVDWHWDFGNPLIISDTSIIQNPNFMYNYKGDYNIEFVVENNLGCIDTLLKTITINDGPSAAFDFDIPCKGNPTLFFDFSDTADVQINSWFWDFGDLTSAEDTSIIQNPEFIYITEGNYDVKLVITDNNNCSDTITNSVEVHPIPTSSFEITSNYEGIQGQIFFNNTSVGDSLSYWDFGNGETSEEDSPVILYNEDDTFLITLTSWNQFNCPDTSTMKFEMFFKGLYIPNAFAPKSPNAGIKLFSPKGYNLRQYKIEIYSKWGNLVWSSSKLDDEGRPAESWDGIYHETLLPQGSYVWKATATFRDNTIWEGTDNGDGNLNTFGTVTLIH